MGSPSRCFLLRACNVCINNGMMHLCASTNLSSTICSKIQLSRLTFGPSVGAFFHWQVCKHWTSPSISKHHYIARAAPSKPRHFAFAGAHSCRSVWICLDDWQRPKELRLLTSTRWRGQSLPTCCSSKWYLGHQAKLGKCKRIVRWMVGRWPLSHALVQGTSRITTATRATIHRPALWRPGCVMMCDGNSWDGGFKKVKWVKCRVFSQMISIWEIATYYMLRLSGMTADSRLQILILNGWLKWTT